MADLDEHPTAGCQSTQQQQRPRHARSATRSRSRHRDPADAQRATPTPLPRKMAPFSALAKLQRAQSLRRIHHVRRPHPPAWRQQRRAWLEANKPRYEAHPLRAMDALHLACALAVKPDLFVSADRRQLVAAKRAGLKIADVSA